MELVTGLGKTGHSIARYLKRRNQPFIVFDTRTHPDCLPEFKAEFPEVEIFLGTIPPTQFERISSIISSPGVPLDNASLCQAVERGIPIIGDIECLARSVIAPVVAITGTNGKSTVTTLVGEMAKEDGLRVAVGGNIGLPVLDLLDDPTDYELWVLELSSFQLELTHTLAPIAATILNVSPDHLDRHHDFQTYRNAKLRVYHQAKTVLYNRDDSQTFQPKQTSTQIYSSYGLDAPREDQWGLMSKNGKQYLSQGTNCLLPVDALKIKGRHNWLNALAACALSQAAGIRPKAIEVVLSRFTGLPHRSQWVRTIDGVDWINDSKGTNIGATLSAITGIGGSMQGKIVLIAGGQGKGADFTELCAPVSDYVRTVVLIGEDADKLEGVLKDVVDVIRATTLDDAVIRAKSEARPGDVVLLSPACASLDMFRDFNHRGEVFTTVVNAL